MRYSTSSLRGVICILFLFILSVGLPKVYAGTGTAVTGIWRLSTTWSFDGVQRTPGCGDSIIIPVGVTVTVDNHESYTSCSQPMHIEVRGILQLVNGYKIDLPCSSSVTIVTGGILQKSTPGGGNSTFIQICGCAAWTAWQGVVNGPEILNCSILPVSFLHFEAEQKQNDIYLQWTTATEVNNDFFTIERSDDGKSFYTLERIKGAGNSTIRMDYSFVDHKSFSGIVYYRVKQTDFDGKFSYTEIVALKKNSIEDEITCSVDNRRLKVRFMNYDNGNSFLNIFDYSGKILLSEEIKTNTGLNSFEVALPAFLHGIYLLTIDREYNNDLLKSKIFVN